jgi:sugar-specific transcriptional regulator TrmB
MHHSALENIGLTEKESEVYEALLRIGPSTIPLILDAVPYKRGDIYNILTGLEDWELIDIKETDKKRLYIAKHPSKLEEIVKEQEKEVQKQKNTLTEVLGDLKSMYNLSYNKPGIRYYEGEAGVKEVWWDTLNSKTEVYTYGDLETLITKFRKWNDKYVRERKKRDIVKKAITNDSAFNRQFLTKYDKKHTTCRIIKNFPIDFSSTIMQIYDGKISFTSINDKTMIGIILEDPFIYRMKKNLFEYLWETSTRS